MKKARILIVEDERIVAEDIKKALQRFGYFVCGIAVSGEEAVRIAGQKRPDLVLMDTVLEGEMDGIEAAEVICEKFDIPIVYVTGYADEETIERIKKTEPYGYIYKPFDDNSLFANIEIALYMHKGGKRK